MNAFVDRLINLVDPSRNVLLNMSADRALAALASGNAERIRAIEGAFALVAQDGPVVRLARSIGRPMRYFLAKRAAGPCLIVAERIDAIRRALEDDGLGAQFHPSYTRMVPAHYVVEIALVGCPDPNPTYRRFFTPAEERLPADSGAIGRAYISALAGACERWLDTLGPREPIGVLFSGGVDSGSVLLVLYNLLLKRGESPARLKAFTLSVQDGGEDVRQAREFLEALGLSLLLEVIEVPASAVDYREAIGVMEDYKPLDVEAAAVSLALCRGIRQRYPDWRRLVDGDGGDENLKDYAIEENSELTMRSVLSNRLLYHEGWGVDAVKHSLVYSGGLSRGYVRSFAPARHFGFESFSPYTMPSVIEPAERIPFIELTGWNMQRLYALKGEIVRCGVKAVTGLTMPVFEKRRFQRGAMPGPEFSKRFPHGAAEYRRLFNELYA